MSAQVYSVLGRTEGRGKVLLEWTSIGLFYPLNVLLLYILLTVHVGGNVNYYKSYKCSLSYSNSACEIREHLGTFQNKLVSSPFN